MFHRDLHVHCHKLPEKAAEDQYSEMVILSLPHLSQKFAVLPCQVDSEFSPTISCNLHCMS